MRLTSLLRAPPTIGAGLHAGGRHEAAAAPFVRSACSLVSKMSKIVAPKKGRSGEYRIRTDGLLHAMQAL